MLKKTSFAARPDSLERNSAIPLENPCQKAAMMFRIDSKGRLSLRGADPIFLRNVSLIDNVL